MRAELAGNTVAEQLPPGPVEPRALTETHSSPYQHLNTIRRVEQDGRQSNRSGFCIRTALSGSYVAD